MKHQINSTIFNDVKYVIELDSIRQACVGLKSDFIQSRNTDQTALDQEVRYIAGLALSCMFNFQQSEETYDLVCNLRFPEFFEEIAQEIADSYVWRRLYESGLHIPYDLEVIDNFGTAVIHTRVINR